MVKFANFANNFFHCPLENNTTNFKLSPEPEKTDIKCEKCGSPMLKRIGKRGPFLTCSAFPKCRNLQWVKTDSEGNIIIEKKESKKATEKKTKTKKSEK